MSNITPPPELVQQWVDTYFGGKVSQSYFHVDLATRAAAWGGDQELDACCEYVYERLKLTTVAHIAQDLRAARRPKPPSLKERALEDLAHIEANCGHLTMPETRLLAKRADTIRRALKALPE